MGVATSFFEKWIVPATIALFSILATIAYQQYSTRSNLTLTIVEQSAIVESVDAISDIEVIYNGKKVRKLFSTKFTLENTGNKSIKKENFVSPLLLQFEENILGVTSNGVEPKSLDGSILIQNNNNKSIIFSIPLLNPGDRISFSILSESENITPRVNTRIEGIADVTVRDVKNVNSETTKLMIKIKYGTMFFAFAIALFMGIALLINFIKKRIYLKNSKDSSILIDVASDEQLRQKIEKELSFLTRENKLSLYFSIVELLSKSPNTDSNAKDNQEVLINKARQVNVLVDSVIKKDAQGVAAVLLFAISFTLFYYFYL